MKMDNSFAVCDLREKAQQKGPLGHCPFIELEGGVGRVIERGIGRGKGRGI